MEPGSHVWHRGDWYEVNCPSGQYLQRSIRTIANHSTELVLAGALMRHAGGGKEGHVWCATHKALGGTCNRIVLINFAAHVMKAFGCRHFVADIRASGASIPQCEFRDIASWPVIAPV